MSEQFLYFLQQMFNGVTLGSTYALIAIGYTMVYGIIGMINFAHGEVYMIGSYVSFMIIAALMMMGIDTGWLLVAAGFVGAITRSVLMPSRLAIFRSSAQARQARPIRE
ncbi:ABC transporter permease subunit [Escherichia coli]|uniref:ABC transporter permease subunit n=1 Tax=Escherichia coli TaxID=562 RepID=UPI00300AB725